MQKGLALVTGRQVAQPRQALEIGLAWAGRAQSAAASTPARPTRCESRALHLRARAPSRRVTCRSIRCRRRSRIEPVRMKNDSWSWSGESAGRGPDRPRSHVPAVQAEQPVGRRTGFQVIHGVSAGITQFGPVTGPPHTCGLAPRPGRDTAAVGSSSRSDTRQGGCREATSAASAGSASWRSATLVGPGSRRCISHPQARLLILAGASAAPRRSGHDLSQRRR